MEYREIVINVDFVGNGEFSDVLQIPSDISWADFELVLQVQFNCNDFKTQYVDDEGELVTLSSHEELLQAIKVARKNNNTLQMRITSKASGPNPNILPQDTPPSVESVAVPTYPGCVVSDAIPSYPGPQPTKPVMPPCKEEEESDDDGCDSNGPDDKDEHRSDDSGKADRPLRHHGPDLVKRKKKKMDYFAWLAQDMGRLRKSSDVRPKRLHHETELHRGEASGRIPPPWFTDYMNKFKQEIINEVTNKVMLKNRQRRMPSELGNDGHDTKLTANTGVNADRCHTGILCDNCEQGIQGTRYKCGNCLDFDLCEPCEQAGVEHDESHLFVKINRPIHGIGRKDNGAMKPLLKKSACRPAGSPKKGLPAERKIMKIKKLEKKLTKTQEKLHALLPDSNVEREHLLNVDNHRQIRTQKMKYEATFVQDVTYPDGCHVYVGQKFTKCWTVRNAGQTQWPHNTKLKLLWGNLMSEHTEVPSPALEPNSEGTVSVELQAPPKPGIYQSHWRLHSADEGFGHRLWCHVVVDSLPPDTTQPQTDEARSETPAEEAVVEAEATNSVSSAIENALACCKGEPKAPSTQNDTKPASDDQTSSETDSDDRGSTSGSMSGSVEADLLSAKNILSCENLEVEIRNIPTISQTATPNNTPLVVTPPNERTPLSSGVSRRSSMELVEAEECQGEMTELVCKKITSLTLENDGDTGSLSHSSSSSSLSTENDYYIVPLPECFILDRPMSRSILRSQSESDAQSVEALSIKTTEDNDEVTKTENEPEVEVCEHLTTDVQEPHSTVENDQAIAEALGDEEQNDLSGTFIDADCSDDDNVEGCQADEETELKIDPGAATAHAQDTTDSCDKHQPHSPTAIASNLASTAIDVASQVATKAYSAAKGIYHHLQAHEQYTPPRSTWTPPQATWTPTPSAWHPQAEEWQERPDQELTPMEKLIDMGFADRTENQRLLDKHNNDVQKVLQELLESPENDWHQTRH